MYGARFEGDVDDVAGLLYHALRLPHDFFADLPEVGKNLQA